MAAIPILFSELYIVAKFFLNLLLLKLTTTLLSRRSLATQTSDDDVLPTTDDDDDRRRLIDEKYPHYHYHEPRRPAGGGEEDCAVCLCEFEKGDAVRELGCRHAFHKDCVDTWFALEARKKRGNKNSAAGVMTCPLCRSGVLLPGRRRRRGGGGGGGGEVGPTRQDDSLDWGQQQFVLLLATLRGDYREIGINQ